MSETDPKLSHITLGTLPASVVVSRDYPGQPQTAPSASLQDHDQEVDCFPLHTRHEFFSCSYLGPHPRVPAHFGVMGAWGVGVPCSGRAWVVTLVYHRTIHAALLLLTCNLEGDPTWVVVMEPAADGPAKPMVCGSSQDTTLGCLGRNAMRAPGCQTHRRLGADDWPFGGRECGEYGMCSTDWKVGW